MKPKILITIKYDITDQMANYPKMSDQEIKEYFGDTPEIIQECDFHTDKKGNIVWEVERI